MPYIQLNNPLKNEKTYSMNWMAFNQKRLNQMALDDPQRFQIPSIQ